jgi:hypothetical protein
MITGPNAGDLRRFLTEQHGRLQTLIVMLGDELRCYDQQPPLTFQDAIEASVIGDRSLTGDNATWQISVGRLHDDVKVLIDEMGITQLTPRQTELRSYLLEQGWLLRSYLR